METYIGPGKVDELRLRRERLPVVIFDDELSRVINPARKAIGKMWALWTELLLIMTSCSTCTPARHAQLGCCTGLPALTALDSS
jgi:hypothetical protein